MQPQENDLLQRMTEGMEAARIVAMKDAIRWNQPLIVWEDNKIAYIPPERLKDELAQMGHDYR